MQNRDNRFKFTYFENYYSLHIWIVWFRFNQHRLNIMVWERVLAEVGERLQQGAVHAVNHSGQVVVKTYLKSPSLYFPKAWRMTVIIAIRGFTTQNWRVAWGSKIERVRSGSKHPGKKDLKKKLVKRNTRPIKSSKATPVCFTYKSFQNVKAQYEAFNDEQFLMTITLKDMDVTITCLQKRRKPMEYVFPHRQQVPYIQLDLKWSACSYR